MSDPEHTPSRSIVARIGPRPPAPVAPPAQEVAQENASAAALPEQDARWAFAVRVASSIGPGGVLPPQVRSRLVAQAGKLGLAQFDASLVIAIVQQGARVGGDGPLGPLARRRVALVRAPTPARPYRTLLIVSMILGAAWSVMLVLWLLS